jgi:hypothetical protein
MPLRKPSPKAKHVRAVSAAGVCAVILICALVPMEVRAQSDPCAAPILTPQSCPLEPGDSIAAGTKAALACAWVSPGGTDHLLEAVHLATNIPQVPGAGQKMLVELNRASAGDEDLFRAALGNPDAYGQPTVQGLPDFLDTLTKANTLPKPTDDNKQNYRAALLVCTQDIVNDLFDTGPGKLALARINESFGRKDKYVALYQLLDAVWQQNDAWHLEKLRAAFDLSADDLGKQIAAKISASKE